MSILGKLANGVGQIACGLGGVAIQLTGEIVGGVGNKLAPNSLIFDDIKDATDIISNKMYDSCSDVGEFTESAVDTVFKISGDLGSGIAGGVADLAGASQDDVEKAKKAGRIIGGVAIGLVAGDAIGGAITSVAGAGAAGTGAAISGLHGAAHTSAVMANIGGGTLAAGGAGVAGGHAVLAGIDVACAVSGAKEAINQQNKSYSKPEMIITTDDSGRKGR